MVRRENGQLECRVCEALVRESETESPELPQLYPCLPELGIALRSEYS